MRRIVVALIVCSIAVPLLAQDPAKVGANVYKCVFENERLRVCEVTFKPGASVAMHSHPQHVVYVTSAGRLKITPASGEPVEVDFKAGQAVWSEPDTHSAVNVGKTEVRGLVIELREPPRAADPVVSALLQMERDWAAAMVAGNVDKVETFVADDWVLTDPMGARVSRAQALADLRSGALKFESTTTSELKVNVYGDSAIVTGKSTDKGTYKGMDISGDYVFTDVFVKRDGQWRAVSTHVTRVVPRQ